jgi:hypothetical protein
MRVAGEFDNTNAENKTARDQAFARLVKLLSEMGQSKSPPR